MYSFKKTHLVSAGDKVSSTFVKRMMYQRMHMPFNPDTRAVDVPGEGGHEVERPCGAVVLGRCS